MNRLLELAERDLSEARDNLCRAKMAAAITDPSKEYGSSGKTLNEIIAEYETWEREALATLSIAKAKERGDL